LFEMVGRDAFGRLGRLRTGHGVIRTPTVLPVVNPFRQPISPNRIVEEMGASALITNAYLLYKDPDTRRRVLREGIHEFLGVDCPIATDSGGYQIYRGQELGVSPEEIHTFQKEIGSDLAVVLDVPPTEDMSEEEARSCVEESLRRSRKLVSERLDGPLWYGVVHLTPHDRLRRSEAREVSRMPFDVYALGSCVGSLIEYQFSSHVDRAMDVAKRLDPSKPRHVFGVGHPMFLALSAAFGGDLFDSAMYALAAQGGRYLTPNGTLRVEDLDELPCSCPVCVNSTAEDMAGGEEGMRLLASHNLYVTFEEIRRTRQAIRDNRLWELAQIRARSHPKLLGALFTGMRRHRRFLETVDPFTKRSAFFYSGPESKLRPTYSRARRMARRRLPGAPGFRHPFYGWIPRAVSQCYPFGQTELPTELKVDSARGGVTDSEMVKGAVDYQFGAGCGDALEPFTVVRSRKTGRVRRVEREGRPLGAIRSRDFFFLPSLEGALLIKEHLAYPSLRVVVSDDASPFVSRGRSLFAKFVDSCDPEIIPGQEVFLVDGDDQLIATGTTTMNAREMMSFRVGVAVKVRHKTVSDEPQG